MAHQQAALANGIETRSRPAIPTAWARRSTSLIHFDSYEEMVHDLHSQIISLATGGSAGASYEIKVVLVEA